MTELPNVARVLIIGGGAREHALTWKLGCSPRKLHLFAAPGNPGIADIAECVSVNTANVQEVAAFAQTEKIDLVVVGPEAPLGQGLVDALKAAGVRAFGPEQAAAALETSKVFAKQVMKEAGVPTASYEVFRDATAAKAYIREQGAPIVVKADGLAAGKGVVVAGTVAEAEEAVDAMMIQQKFGAAGTEVVVESLLVGSEASLMYFVDKNTVVPMIPAQDHKRIGEGDTGPNTGGMGAFAPIPGVDTVELQADVTQRIVMPTLDWLRERGIVYRGVLYVGLMLTETGPQVVEFNVRFGDPEAEVLLPLLRSDLFDILWAVTEDALTPSLVEWHDDAAVCVVLATPGYPEQPITGQVIEGLEQFSDEDATEAVRGDGAGPEDEAGGEVGARDKVEGKEAAVCFHAGTRQNGAQVLTSGGRVLTVAAKGPSMEAARAIAYSAAQGIYFEGMQLRRDIGTKHSD